MLKEEIRDCSAIDLSYHPGRDEPTTSGHTEREEAEENIQETIPGQHFFY